MGAISATDIISIIQSEIENFDFDTESRETGEVIYVGDGIATIYGIDHAMYGEIVVFDNGVKGMVQDIRQNGALALLPHNTALCALIQQGTALAAQKLIQINVFFCQCHSNSLFISAINSGVVPQQPPIRSAPASSSTRIWVANSAAVMG